MEKTTLPTLHLEQSNSKTNVLQKLLLLTKLQKRHELSIKCKTEGLFKNKTLKNNNNASDAKLQQQLTKLDDHKPLQQQILKPSTTVTGFKKLMYNFVKLSQNQLQPSYNRRKYNHTHYNQTLKERTRLSRTYVYLSKPTIKNYCAFTIKPTSFWEKARFARFSPSMYSLQNFISSIDNPFYGGTLQTLAPFACSSKANSDSLESKTTLPTTAGGKPSIKEPSLISVRSLIKNYNKIRLENTPIAYHRPIPKIVNFLESRLDVILWKNQFASSIKSARQNLRQGVLVNGGLQKKTSFQALPGDVFTFNK